MRRIFLFALFLLSTLSVVAQEAQKPAPPPKTVYIRAGRLFDGTLRLMGSAFNSIFVQCTSPKFRG